MRQGVGGYEERSKGDVKVLNGDGETLKDDRFKW